MKEKLRCRKGEAERHRGVGLSHQCGGQNEHLLAEEMSCNISITKEP